MEEIAVEFEEVEVFIDKDGRIQLHVKGVKGMSCLDTTKSLEEALGGEVESKEMTSDAYETVQEIVQNRQEEKH